MEQESGGSTTLTAIAEERMEESDSCSEESSGCREDSQSSSPCDSPWNSPHPCKCYRQWEGRPVLERNEITYSDPPSAFSSSSSSSSLSRSSSSIRNLDDSIKDLSLELQKLLEAKDMIQSKLNDERRKHPVDKAVTDEVQSWFLHVDKSIKLGNTLLRPKCHMKLVPWSKQHQNRDASKKKKVILDLMKTFLKLKSQAEDLVDAIAQIPIQEQLKKLKMQNYYFSFEQIKVATDNFDPKNLIGRGGFGLVYKGVLQDGSTVAVKQNSHNSWEGNREFVNEIGMLSSLQHRNIVELFGCCIEGSELLIIYEYMENNSLARALFGPESSRLKLDWQRRRRISFHIARGLAYLHEESRFKIIHRDIKAANILLDKNLDAKISYFGVAILDDDIDEENTEIIGAPGYMAPEYAMRGCLTEKADVYSYGVVLLEIVSGKSNTHYRPKEDFVSLLDWARALKDQGNLLDLVDPNMGSNFSIAEAKQMLNLALLCTNPSPTLRPTMTAVVCMIGGGTHVSIPSMEIGPWLESSMALSSSNGDAISSSVTTRLNG